MSYETKYAVRSVLINSSTWTDVQGINILPIACNSVTIFNDSGVDVYFRSDPNNTDSQITLPSRIQPSDYPLPPIPSLEIGHGVFYAGTRFPSLCDPVGSLCSSGGTVTVTIVSVL